MHGGVFRVYEADECGADGYPFAWHETIKHDVRALALNRCVRCGHPYRVGEHGNGEWSPCDNLCHHGGNVRWLRDGIPVSVEGHDCSWVDVAAVYDHEPAVTIEARWRILTVHHLDGDKRNCRWWNLAALCQRCHLAIQGKVQMARVWPWEHSEWFRPYVAGYYAWAYLGEDLTRDETIGRLDELLDLERAA
jgi:hypothetical protein